MSVTERLDGVQQRFPALGFPIAVVYKFFDDQGSYLAALITYYGFLSFFPLLLLLSSVLGFALSRDPALQRQVLDSTLSQFPVIGPQLHSPQGLHGSVTAVVVGVVASLYGGLGVAQAIQHAMNTAWTVQRNKRPNPLLARVRSLLLLMVGGVAVIATSGMASLAASPRVLGIELGAATKVLSVVGSVVVNTALLVLVFRIATARRLGSRDVLPGALVAAVLWLLLQTFGARYVGGVVQGRSDTNGVFALVLGMVAWIYLSAVAVVLCVEIDVVHVDRLWPRALLTPFTDDVDLTAGDARAYTGAAKAQQAKGFESVEVSFDGDGRDRHGRRRRASR